MTAIVPLALLAQLRPDGFDWQVPGMRDELLAGLLRSLPKAIRRHVVPAADWAAKLAEELAGQGPESHDGLPPARLLDALAARIQRVANQPVSAADFDLERVPVAPADLVPRGGRARPCRRHRSRSRRAAGPPVGPCPRIGREVPHPRRSSSEPRQRASERSALKLPPSAAFAERSGLTDWTFGDLPDVVDTRVAGGVVRGYPALVDEGTSVALRIESTPAAAAAATHAGARRLVLLVGPLALRRTCSTT